VTNARGCEGRSVVVDARPEAGSIIIRNSGVTFDLPTDLENHAAYVSGWLKKLHEDKRELFGCA